MVAGILFGTLFGSANAYLGLRVGLTVSTSIPIAVLTVALFKLMPQRRDGRMLMAGERNPQLLQTRLDGLLLRRHG